GRRLDVDALLLEPHRVVAAGQVTFGRDLHLETPVPLLRVSASVLDPPGFDDAEVPVDLPGFYGAEEAPADGDGERADDEFSGRVHAGPQVHVGSPSNAFHQVSWPQLGQAAR